jgi:anti-sigma factor ChrR (cupin superfamily)
MVNCKEATFLMAKKEEGKLGIVENMKLSMHTSMCSFCRKFEKQAKHIGKESRHVHAADDLPTLAKEKIEKILGEYSS